VASTADSLAEARRAAREAYRLAAFHAQTSRPGLGWSPKRARRALVLLGLTWGARASRVVPRFVVAFAAIIAIADACAHILRPLVLRALGVRRDARIPR
jgi:hypothetical protein